MLFFKHAGMIERVVFGNETQAQDEEDDDTSEEDGEGEDVVMELGRPRWDARRL